MPYRCKNSQGDYDGNIYQNYGDAYRRAQYLNKIHIYESWFPEQIESPAASRNSGDNSAPLPGWVWVLFIVIIIGNAFYDKVVVKYVDMSNASLYCSAEQLPKTGRKACIDAKNAVIKRLREDLKSANESLKYAQLETPNLLQNTNKKCSKSGLEMYGTEGCVQAQNSLEENYQRIEKLKNEIKTYQSDMDKYKRLGVNGSHIVDTDILNLRSCASTDCHIVAKLSLGEGVWLQETEGDWAKVRSEKGEGFVANKFLIKNEDTAQVSESKK